MKLAQKNREKREILRLNALVKRLKEKTNDGIGTANMLEGLIDSSFHGIHISPYREWLKIHVQKIIENLK